MIAANVIARLAATCRPPFRLVEGAAELAALTAEGPTTWPAAYVFTIEKAAGENLRAGGGHLQRVEVDFAVMIVAGNASDGTGAAAVADVEGLEGAVVVALVGWRPASATDPCELVGAELVRMKNGLVWVQVRFGTTYTLEA